MQQRVVNERWEVDCCCGDAYPAGGNVTEEVSGGALCALREARRVCCLRLDAQRSAVACGVLAVHRLAIVGRDPGEGRDWSTQNAADRRNIPSLQWADTPLRYDIPCDLHQAPRIRQVLRFIHTAQHHNLRCLRARQHR